ncbi:type II modification methylase [candidate division LCP-89 bacterium B3_LCP]|uniref:Type II modification methylase n=1 Tax=candidate division LCP-89 bacterium B3_LCP TaxID=2012998 RepID=A0A532UYW3_UNCL8|nr:MAG: type II modification methylase [candidate division LCP-89 bacterium B3_LCP]
MKNSNFIGLPFSGQISLFKDVDKDNYNKQILIPEGYKGFSAFHKYWGKKPVEYLVFLIEILTVPGEIILDPFLGSGLIVREAVSRGRNFIGIDINPISVEMAVLSLDLPLLSSFKEAIEQMHIEVRPEIEKTYKMKDSRIATHYLWEGDSLKSVWIAGRGKGKRQEIKPDNHDLDNLAKHYNYQSEFIREIKLFQNSRINTFKGMTTREIFTGRALFNIDLLLEYINSQPEQLRRALLLSLTAASGQMSKMVFAITGRGKTNGVRSDKIEVGSWVIGYWRPKLHFEINVWNCFINRALKLQKLLSDLKKPPHIRIVNDLDPLIGNCETTACIIGSDARVKMNEIKDESVSLVLTDPPHSDRIPYLELSELWNSIIGSESDFTKEIVVSNAKGRNKTKSVYSNEMKNFFSEAIRVTKKGGFIAFLFNARDELSWSYLKDFKELSEGIEYVGYFPMAYSANSVVQDNRKGGLKNDYILIYQKNTSTCSSTNHLSILNHLPGWSISFPTLKGD